MEDVEFQNFPTKKCNTDTFTFILNIFLIIGMSFFIFLNCLKIFQIDLKVDDNLYINKTEIEYFPLYEGDRLKTHSFQYFFTNSQNITNLKLELSAERNNPECQPKIPVNFTVSKIVGNRTETILYKKITNFQYVDDKISRESSLQTFSVKLPPTTEDFLVNINFTCDGFDIAGFHGRNILSIRSTKQITNFLTSIRTSSIYAFVFVLVQFIFCKKDFLSIFSLILSFSWFLLIILWNLNTFTSSFYQISLVVLISLYQTFVFSTGLYLLALPFRKAWFILSISIIVFLAQFYAFNLYFTEDSNPFYSFFTSVNENKLEVYFAFQVFFCFVTIIFWTGNVIFQTSSSKLISIFVLLSTIYSYYKNLVFSFSLMNSFYNENTASQNISFNFYLSFLFSSFYCLLFTLPETNSPNSNELQLLIIKEESNDDSS